MLYLFGFSIRGEEVLESVPNQFSIDLPEHEGKDLVRFPEGAFRGATHFIVSLPSGETLDADKFLHFDFFLVEPGFENSAKLYNPPTTPPVPSCFTRRRRAFLGGSGEGKSHSTPRPKGNGAYWSFAANRNSHKSCYHHDPWIGVF